MPMTLRVMDYAGRNPVFQNRWGADDGSGYPTIMMDRFTDQVGGADMLNTGPRDFPAYGFHLCPITIPTGQTWHWIRARNKSDNTNSPRVYVFTTDPSNPMFLQQWTNFSYVTQGFQQIHWQGTAGDKFLVCIAMENPDDVITWEHGDGMMSAASVVAKPVFTARTDGKFTVSCATSGADIFVIGDSLCFQAKYLSSPKPFAVGETIRAFATKDGWDSSSDATYVIAQTLVTPTFIDKGTYINVVTHDAGVPNLVVKYTKNGGAEQTYNPATGVTVTSGDTVVAWVTDSTSAYTNSPTAQFDKA